MSCDKFVGIAAPIIGGSAPTSVHAHNSDSALRSVLGSGNTAPCPIKKMASVMCQLILRRNSFASFLEFSRKSVASPVKIGSMTVALRFWRPVTSGRTFSSQIYISNNSPLFLRRMQRYAVFGRI